MDDNTEDIVDTSRERLNSAYCFDNVEAFGHPRVHPRVGDEFQVEIPQLLSKNDYLSIYRDSVEIPIRSNNDDVQFRSEPLCTEQVHEEGVGERLPKLQPVVNVDDLHANFVSHQKMERNLDHESNGCHPISGSTSDAGKDIECNSFLLGLYIFGKDLYLVKKFVDSKNMGHILSYYYTQFYKSAEHLRWSQSRKMKARRCVQGERIFIGWRQQELLSRIFPHVSDENKISLTEVSRSFGEGKLSLEEYVFTLKHMVGVSVLVEAVSIGKGKQDLTGTAVDPSKTYNVLPTRPEIPTGKACSLLTKDEIINYLTGNFRLSKARSNDLFWEAVWPRLLARGWHSEQPWDLINVSLKNSLVFLVPGVKKFSRRKLVKGTHYFDSVSDILNKVAAEPAHLDLESEAVEVTLDKEECSSDPDDVSNRKRHRYLRPRISNCSQDSLKLTIVDTSFVCGGQPVKVRELNNIPVETINVPIPSERGTTEHSKDKQDPNITSKFEPENGKVDNSAQCVLNAAINCMPRGPEAIVATVENHEDQRTVLGDIQSSKMKFQFSRKRKSCQPSNLGAITKQNELVACGHGESKNGVESVFLDHKINGESRSPDRCEVRDSVVKSCQNLIPSASNPKETNKKANLCTLSTVKESLPEKTQPEILIDLNQPHIPPDSGTDVPVVDNVRSSTILPSLLSAIDQQKPDFLHRSNNGDGIEQQNVMNGRRHSTRNRPLTTKALEAFAFDYLAPKKKRKGMDSTSKRNPGSSSSQQVHGKADLSESDINVVDEGVAYHEGEKKVAGDTTVGSVPKMFQENHLPRLSGSHTI